MMAMAQENRNLTTPPDAGRLAVAAAVLVAAALLFAGCEKAPDKRADDGPVVIRVGERAITRGEYRAALARVMPEAPEAAVGEQAGGITDREAENLKRELVGQLIEEELILGEADRLGVTVSDRELADEVASIRDDYVGVEDFRSAIRKNYGNMEAWKKVLARRHLVRKTIEKHIASKVEVSDADVRSYYDENTEEFEVPEMVRARMIVVTDAAEAERIRDKLRPEGFATIAREVSLSPEAADGGDLGYFARGEMPVEFEEAVFGLEPGVISDVVKTDYGYHIFLVEEKRPPGKLAFDEVSGTIREGLFRERAEEELTRWLAELKKNTRITVKEELL